MNLTEFLSSLESSHIQLQLVGDELKIKAPKDVLTPQFLATLKERKREIIHFLNDTSGAELYQPIEAIEEQQYYRASHAQQRLWMLDQQEEKLLAYNIAQTYQLDEAMDQMVFEQTLTALVSRHEILRTSLFPLDGILRQRTYDAAAIGFAVDFVDLVGEVDAERELQKRLRNAANSAFDLARPPLLRATLIRLNAEKYLLQLVMHHIITDVWSMQVMEREFSQLYAFYKEKKKPVLHALKIQYRDFTAWQNRQLRLGKLSEDEQYWLTQFSGELPVLFLPTKSGRPASRTYWGQHKNFFMDQVLREKLSVLNESTGTSMFMVLVASLNALLFRYSGQEDIIIGTSIAGRDHLDLESQVGFYANTLALRTRFSSKDTFEILLKNVRTVTLDAYLHQRFPFDLLVRQLNLEWDRSRSPLFDVEVNLQNARELKENSGFTGLDTSEVSVLEQKSKFDLQFNFTEWSDGIEMNICFNTDLFEPDWVAQLGGHYLNLLKSILDNPATPLGELTLLSASEAMRLLRDFNATQTALPAEGTITSLFTRQASQHPEQVALRSQGQSFTYQQLEEQSNQLARYLRQLRQVRAGDLVGLTSTRNQHLAIGLLAILKAGGVYLPLDASLPAARLSYLLEDTAAGVWLVSEPGLLAASFREDARVCYLSDCWAQLSEYPSQGEEWPVGKEQGAYVIYTSGSTGKPKGVLVTHGNLVNFCVGMNQALALDPTDHLLAIASSSFDISLLELVWTLCRGVGVSLADEPLVTGDLDRYGQELPPITMLQATPSLLRLLLDDAHSRQFISSLKYVLIGGEGWGQELLERLRAKTNATVYNAYGPTETTIYSTVARLGHQDPFTVGGPMANTQIYLLDSQRNLLPMGMVGEVYLGGEGIAAGYLNQPELTADRFTPNPFDKAHGRIYRSGDLGKWLPDGKLQIFGRNDHQVKFKGYRIELGEIEHALQGMVKQAVVMLENQGKSQAELVAYCEMEDELDLTVVRSFLGERLPVYMVPSRIVRVERLPINSNGKVDRKALLQEQRASGETHSDYVSPKSPLEKDLVSIYQQVLGKSPIGIKDSFYRVGGNSMKAIQLVNRINQTLGVSATLKDVFMNPTPEEMAQVVIRLGMTPQ